jgi:hypothetical protein
MEHEHDQICPFCFTVYPPGVLDPDVPVCRECNTFGRAIILEDYLEFKASTSVEQVKSIRQSWLDRSQFLEAERELVLKNIDEYLAEGSPE